MQNHANITALRDLVRELNSKKSEEELLAAAGDLLPVYMRLVGRTEYLGHPDQKWGPISYAQRGEDLFILSLFERIGISEPNYLDIGAHHPSIISNTKLLYDRGCRGVNVEPNPTLFKFFEAERPLDVNVLAGVVPLPEGLVSAMRTFYMFGETSGRNTFCIEEARRFEEETGGRFKVQKEIKIGCHPINEIVERYCGGVWPAFLNVDIEGLDAAVLHEADFSETAPSVICAEIKDLRDGFLIAMGDKGFHVVSRIGDNVFFVHDSLVVELVQ